MQTEYSQTHHFGNIRTSANIGSARDEYSSKASYIAPLDPIYAPYVDRTSNISSSGRISAMYSSILGLPMVYITQISSNSSAFETIRVNKSMNTCPILVQVRVLDRVRARIFANTNIYSFHTLPQRHGGFLWQRHLHHPPKSAGRPPRTAPQRFVPPKCHPGD